jgi:hypothetical protein
MKTMNLLPALALAAFAGASLPSPLQAWEPVGDKIKTRFSQDVDPSNPLPEYPRPQLVRQIWTNLNGLWSYAIVGSDAPEPDTWDGEILVRFAVDLP